MRKPLQGGFIAMKDGQADESMLMAQVIAGLRTSPVIASPTVLFAIRIRPCNEWPGGAVESG